MVELKAPRGTVLDRAGRPLAVSLPVDTVVVNPMLVPDISMAASILASVLNMDAAQLRTDIEQARTDPARRGFLRVKRRISTVESERLKSLRLDWIEFRRESRRVYPNKRLPRTCSAGRRRRAGQLSVLELAMNDELTGMSGAERVVRDVRGRRVESKVTTEAAAGRPRRPDHRPEHPVCGRECAPGDGGNGELSHRQRGCVEGRNERGSRPRQLPGFRSQRTSHAEGTRPPHQPGDIESHRTRLCLQAHHCLLGSRRRPRDARYDDQRGNGTLSLYGRVIHEAKHGYGMLPVTGVLAQSSNIGAIQIGMRLGIRPFHEYIRRFGIDRRPTCRCLTSPGGRIRRAEKWEPTSIGSVAMGHEVSVTTMQLAMACSC